MELLDEHRDKERKARSLISSLRREFKVLPSTTVKNWQLPLPAALINGFILGQAMMSRIPVDSVSSGSGGSEHLPKGILLDVPSNIRDRYPLQVETTWLWARRMWNILVLDTAPENPADPVCSIWRFWEGVSLLPNKPYSTLGHTSFFDEKIYPSDRPFDFYSYELIPKNTPGARLFREGAGTLNFEATISNPHYLSQVSQKTRQPSATPHETSLGYKYVCPWVLSSDPQSSEVFGTQSGICCSEVHFVLSLPNQWVFTKPDKPLLDVHDFRAPINKTALDFFRERIDSGSKSPDGRRADEVRTWNRLHSPATKIFDYSKLNFPALLSADLPNLFGMHRSVFHAVLEHPDPLKALAVSWSSRE
jgi:hypothetical protein